MHAEALDADDLDCSYYRNVLDSELLTRSSCANVRVTVNQDPYMLDPELLVRSSCANVRVTVNQDTNKLDGAAGTDGRKSSFACLLSSMLLGVAAEADEAKGEVLFDFVSMLDGAEQAAQAVQAQAQAPTQAAQAQAAQGQAQAAHAQMQAQAAQALAPNVAAVEKEDAEGEVLHDVASVLGAAEEEEEHNRCALLGAAAEAAEAKGGALQCISATLDSVVEAEETKGGVTYEIGAMLGAAAEAAGSEDGVSYLSDGIRGIAVSAEETMDLFPCRNDAPLPPRGSARTKTAATIDLFPCCNDAPLPTRGSRRTKTGETTDLFPCCSDAPLPHRGSAGTEPADTTVLFPYQGDGMQADAAHAQDPRVGGPNVGSRIQPVGGETAETEDVFPCRGNAEAEESRNDILSHGGSTLRLRVPFEDTAEDALSDDSFIESLARIDCLQSCADSYHTPLAGHQGGCEVAAMRFKSALPGDAPKDSPDGKWERLCYSIMSDQTPGAPISPARLLRVSSGSVSGATFMQMMLHDLTDSEDVVPHNRLEGTIVYDPDDGKDTVLHDRLEGRVQPGTIKDDVISHDRPMGMVLHDANEQDRVAHDRLEGMVLDNSNKDDGILHDRLAETVPHNSRVDGEMAAVTASKGDTHSLAYFMQALNNSLGCCLRSLGLSLPELTAMVNGDVSVLEDPHQQAVVGELLQLRQSFAALFAKAVVSFGSLAASTRSCMPAAGCLPMPPADGTMGQQIMSQHSWGQQSMSQQSMSEHSLMQQGLGSPVVQAMLDEHHHRLILLVSELHLQLLAQFEARLKLSACQLWAMLNLMHPMPSRCVKASLAAYTGKTKKQVTDWFTNWRARHWRPGMLTLAADLDPNSLSP